MDKKAARIRRAAKARARIKLGVGNRLTVHRTLRHIYAQVTTADGARVLASSSTHDEEVKAEVVNTGNIEAAKRVGSSIAKRALSIGISSVSFDRSGFKYHGRIKALADAARETGLIF